jgi:uncharacterized OB-fold protein
VNQPAPPDPAKYLRREMDDVAREFYRRLADEGRLSTTRCASCGHTSFPPRHRCATCGDREQWHDLPLRGRLFAFTTQETALRYRAPDVLALARISTVLVPGVVEAPYESLRVGQEIDVALRREPDTGLTLLLFEPVT